MYNSAHNGFTASVDREKLISPRGIAVIGASRDSSRIGGQPIKALQAAGYTGGIYPVNPRYEEVAGLRCYPDAAHIDEPCDLAIIAVSSAHVLKSIRDCSSAGIEFAVILSGGFRESGDSGATLEHELIAAARAGGVRLIGPNCQGLVNFPNRVFAAFGSITGELDLPQGPVSMAFQSGGFGFAIATQAAAEGVGFRTCISTGNEADLTTPDLLDVFIDDPGTTICAAYIEGLSNGRRLIDVGRKALEASKPLLVWKGGNTESGARAAASHTANMTGSYEVFQSAFRQAGIIEVFDVQEMVDLFKVFSTRRQARGERIGALSISGGSGIVFADRAIRDGLSLPEFGAETARKLAEIVPTFGSAANPIDITAGVFNDMGLFERALEAMIEDDGIDQLAILLASLPGAAALSAARVIVAVAERTEKPVLVGWSVRRDRAEEAYELLEGAGIPIIPTPVRLAHAAAVSARWATQRSTILARPQWADTEDAFPVLPATTRPLDEFSSKQVLADAGIGRSVDVLMPCDGDPAVAAECLTYPLVAKIVSKDIAHKTEVGGVKLGIATPQDLDRAVQDILRSVARHAPGVRLEGILLAEMVTDATEALMGVVQDPCFGPVVAVGLGGIYAEIFGDVSFRVAPFDEDVAREMIFELKSLPIFQGARGREPADIDAFSKTLAQLSQFAWYHRHRLRELDINPALVRPATLSATGMPGGIVIADALMILADVATGGHVRDSDHV